MQFSPESITLTLGTAGQPVNVLQVLDDGETIDVSTTAAVTVADNKIVSVLRTSSGPMLRPMAVGQTQVTATQGASKSTRPLLIQVVDADRAQARLQVAPNPLIVRVGESAAFDRVEVVPAPGQPPVEIAARVESADSESVGVEGGRAFAARRRGGACHA